MKKHDILKIGKGSDSMGKLGINKSKIIAFMGYLTNPTIIKINKYENILENN